MIIEQRQAEIVVRDIKVASNSEPCTKPLEALLNFGTLELYILDIDYASRHIAHSRIVFIIPNL